MTKATYGNGNVAKQKIKWAEKVAVHAPAKQQREMTKFCVVWRTWTTAANFLKFYCKVIVPDSVSL